MVGSRPHDQPGPWKWLCANGAYKFINKPVVLTRDLCTRFTEARRVLSL